MEYLRLGNAGLKVSHICLGMMSFGDSGWRAWVLEEEASRPLGRQALQLAGDEVERPRAPYVPRPVPGHG